MSEALIRPSEYLQEHLNIYDLKGSQKPQLIDSEDHQKLVEYQKQKTF
jgi:hypothetical protein